MKIGDTIKFRLDNSWAGEGRIVYFARDAVDVELTKPCKEFQTGERIIISLNEIVN